MSIGKCHWMSWVNEDGDEVNIVRVIEVMEQYRKEGSKVSGYQNKVKMIFPVISEVLIKLKTFRVQIVCFWNPATFESHISIFIVFNFEQSVNIFFLEHHLTFKIISSLPRKVFIFSLLNHLEIVVLNSNSSVQISIHSLHIDRHSIFNHLCIC